MANEKDNHKFNFLRQNDPYHAYYQEQVEHYKQEMKEEQEGANQQSDAGAKGDQQQNESDKQHEQGKRETPQGDSKSEGTIKRDVTGHARKIEAPDTENYSVEVPDGMMALDLDVIKLTAQFVARNGKSFLTGLTSREHSNPQFAFLKPTHSLFTLFTRLADAYSRVLMPPRGVIDRVKWDAEDKEQLLERCLRRLEWEQAQERAKREADEAAEREREAQARIDWHDFVVAEKIDFDDEEDERLPAPLPQRDIIAQVEGEARGEVAPAAEGEQAEEVEMEMDEDEQELVEEGRKAVGGEEEEEKEARAPPPADESEGQVKVVKNYKPPGRDRPESQREASHEGKVVSPITGELISWDKMAEHMRISLVDPKWKEQREAMLAKIRDVSYASDEEIANNVVGLAKTRPDIFGSTDDEVSVAVSNEIERNRSGSIDEQLASIQSMPGSSSDQQDATQSQQHQQSFQTAPPGTSHPPPPAPPPGVNACPDPCSVSTVTG